MLMVRMGLENSLGYKMENSEWVLNGLGNFCNKLNKQK